MPEAFTGRWDHGAVYAPIRADNRLTAPWRLAARGLIMQARRVAADPIIPRYFKRDIVPYRISPTASRGTCRWCQTEAPSGRHNWHGECHVAFAVARGRTRIGSTSVIRLGPCAACDARRGRDVDHDVALVTGHSMLAAGQRRWWRAWWIENLRCLCVACHKTKSGKEAGARAKEVRIQDQDGLMKKKLSKKDRWLANRKARER